MREAASAASPSSFELYENQLAILRRDNEQLRRRDAEMAAAHRRLYAALDIAEEQDAAAQAKGWKAELQAAQARIAALQIALGIGPDDEPSSAGRGFSNVQETSDLPAYGQLLRMTALARTSPFLQGSYNAVPTQIQTPAGDLWTSGVEEGLDEAGAPVRVVVVRHEPRAYAYQEARIRLVQLESSLAAAIRESAMAGKRLNADRDATSPTMRKTAETQRAEARKRGEEIQAEMERLRPLAVEPKAREWRFAADLEGMARAERAVREEAPEAPQEPG